MKQLVQTLKDGLWLQNVVFAQMLALCPTMAVAMGLGFTGALTLIGLIRELLGSGTLFAQASLLLGPAFRAIELTVIPGYGGFLLMILPPGGFLVLGLLLAGKRALELRARKANAAVAPASALA